MEFTTAELELLRGCVVSTVCEFNMTREEEKKMEDMIKKLEDMLRSK